MKILQEKAVKKEKGATTITTTIVLTSTNPGTIGRTDIASALGVQECRVRLMPRLPSPRLEKEVQTL